MSAPRRWLEEGGSATSLERDLLRSALPLEPPQDAQKAVWAAVLTQIPSLPPGGGAGSAAAAGKAATAGKAAGKVIAAGKASTTAVKTAVLVKGAAGLAGAGVVKSALIGAGSALALIATYSAVTPAPKDAPPSPPVAAAPAPVAHEARTRKSWRADTQANPSPAPAEAPAPAPSAEPRVVPPGETPEPRAASQGGDRPSVAPPPAPTPAAPEGPGSAPATPETSLQEEARLVADARSALRRGDAAGAVRQLDQIGARIPGGKLNQERESLMIEALAKSGRRAEASARASSFLRTYPASPFASSVQGFVVDEAPKPTSP